MPLYLILDLLILAGPLALSFDRKVAFHRKWRFLWKGILVNMLIFIPWDIAFTSLGVWGFNEEYLIGITLWRLPIEEYLFFLVVPYACVFIYACLEVYFPTDRLFRWRKWIIGALLCLLAFLYLKYTGHIYTSVSTLYLSFVLLILLIFGRTDFFGRFFLAYLITLVPFAIFNGVLTAMPVVWYNDLENMGIRLGSIPLDDLIYNMGMLLIPVSFYVRESRK